MFCLLKKYNKLAIVGPMADTLDQMDGDGASDPTQNMPKHPVKVLLTLPPARPMQLVAQIISVPNTMSLISNWQSLALIL